MATESTDWERIYDCDELVYGTGPNAFLAEHASEALPHHGRVLSLGEGEGRNAVWLAARGWKVGAVDMSTSALAKLAHLAAEEGVYVDIWRGNVAEFDSGAEAWDAVVILHMHLPPEARREAHRRAARALKPGGVLILEALRPEQLDQPSSGPDQIECLYTADQLRADFPDLQFKVLRSEDREIYAGQHRGMTSVVSLLARRPG